MEDKTLAYILKTVDYQEHSKLVYFYTETGLHSALARGIKKLSSPYRALIQPGNTVYLTLTKGKLPTVKEAEKTVYYNHIKSDLIKSTVVSVMNELIYFNVSKEDNHEKLFQFVIKVLNTLETTNHPIEILMVFEMKFLYFLGYGINFNSCHVCQKTDYLYFNPHTSMVSCDMHKEPGTHVLNETDFKPLKYYLHLDILTFNALDLSKESLLSLMKTIEELMDYHLGKGLKSKKILYTLL